MESGDWLVPTFNGIPRLDKPPLSHWVVGGFYKLFGISLLWERLVMALAAAGSLATVYLIGRQLFASPVALLGVGILATTFRFHAAARRLPMDTLMLFFDLLAILFVILWVRKEQRPHHFLLAALFFGLAFLTKGPVALFPLGFLVPWFFLYERKPLRPHAGWMVLSSALFLGVSLCWFVALGLGYSWEPVWRFFLAENLGRFAHMDFGPQRNLFYYFGVFVGDFAPWSLLVPSLSMPPSGLVAFLGAESSRCTAPSPVERRRWRCMPLPRLKKPGELLPSSMPSTRWMPSTRAIWESR